MEPFNIDGSRKVEALLSEIPLLGLSKGRDTYRRERID